jgi:hypothetical protein
LIPKVERGGKKEAPQAYIKYVEEADDEANKVIRRIAKLQKNESPV